jgi:SEC-C motif-containing protein
MKWLGLDVKRADQPDDDHASVEFVARSKLAGRAHRLHEISRFVKEDGRWFYLDGDVG